MDHVNSIFGASFFLLVGIYFFFVLPYKNCKDLTSPSLARGYGLRTGILHVVSMFAVMFVFVLLNMLGVLTAYSKESYALWVLAILMLSAGMIMTTTTSFMYLVYNTTHVYTFKKKKISVVVTSFLMFYVIMQMIMPMFVANATNIRNELSDGITRQPVELFRLFVLNTPNPFIDSVNNRYGLGFAMIAIVSYFIMAWVLMPKETKQVLGEWLSGKPQTI